MYNLKNVYGVISFNKSRVNVLVVEKAINGKINCLFFDYLDINYLNDKLEFINKDLLRDKLLELLTKADEFFGVIVKRYIINVSYLPVRVVKNISKDFELNENKELDQNDYLSFVNKVDFLDAVTNERIINVHPELWTLDGHNLSSFPYGKKGRMLNFEYVAYVTNAEMYKRFKDLAEQCKVSCLGIINNQICFSGCLERINEYHKRNLVIDVKSDSSTINFYDTNNNLVYFEKIDTGSNWMVDKVKHQFSIPEGQNLIPIIDSLDAIKLVDTNVSIVNIHKEDFLNLKVATAGAFISYINYTNKKFIELINNRINNILSRIQLSYDNMYINANNMANKFLDQLVNPQFKTFDNNIIGIEDKNLNAMLGAVDYINATQKAKNHIKYSVDPYVSQNTFNDQLKKEILLKVGVITTKWAAKLGG